MLVQRAAQSTISRLGPRAPNQGRQGRENKQGKSEDAKRSAAARFAKTVVETHGKVSDGDLSAVRAAGYTDTQLIEIVALSAGTLMTNFLNNVAETEVDFPAAALVDAA